MPAHKIHGALGKGSLWTRIQFLGTNQTEKTASWCWKEPYWIVLNPVIGAMLVERAHFLSWQIKLAANVITNHSIMKRSGTRVSVQLGLICPGARRELPRASSQGSLSAVPIRSQVRLKLSLPPTAFGSCFFFQCTVFPMLPLARTSLSKKNQKEPEEPWRHRR